MKNATLIKYWISIFVLSAPSWAFSQMHRPDGYRFRCHDAQQQGFAEPSKFNYVLREAVVLDNTLYVRYAFLNSDRSNLSDSEIISMAYGNLKSEDRVDAIKNTEVIWEPKSSNLRSEAIRFKRFAENSLVNRCNEDSQSFFEGRALIYLPRNSQTVKTLNEGDAVRD